VVRVIVGAVSILVAIIVLVARGSQAAVEVLGWPDDVCNRLERFSFLDMLLVIASFALTGVRPRG